MKKILTADYFRRLIQQDEGVQDPNARTMIVSVLIVSLFIDAIFIVTDINTRVMAIYGVVLLVALLLALRGILLPARLIIPLGGLIIFTYLMIVHKGIRDIAILGLPAVIIAGGLLFGKLGTLLYGLLSVGIVLFLGVAEKQGAIVNEFSSYNTMADYLAASIALMTRIIVLNRSVRRYRSNNSRPA